jgi:hypothetical protein
MPKSTRRHALIDSRVTELDHPFKTKGNEKNIAWSNIFFLLRRQDAGGGRTLLKYEERIQGQDDRIAVLEITLVPKLFNIASSS